MTFTHIPDHAERLLHRLPAFLQDKPLVRAITDALGAELQTLEDACQARMAMLDLEQATGLWLDLHGQECGLRRDGQTDVAFRNAIRARWAAFGSGGHAETIAGVLAGRLGLERVACHYVPVYPAGYGFELLLDADPDEHTMAASRQAALHATAAGVRLDALVGGVAATGRRVLVAGQWLGTVETVDAGWVSVAGDVTALVQAGHQLRVAGDDDTETEVALTVAGVTSDGTTAETRIALGTTDTGWAGRMLVAVHLPAGGSCVDFTHWTPGEEAEGTWTPDADAENLAGECAVAW